MAQDPIRPARVTSGWTLTPWPSQTASWASCWERSNWHGLYSAVNEFIVQEEKGCDGCRTRAGKLIWTVARRLEGAATAAGRRFKMIAPNLDTQVPLVTPRFIFLLLQAQTAAKKRQRVKPPAFGLLPLGHESRTEGRVTSTYTLLLCVIYSIWMSTVKRALCGFGQL